MKKILISTSILLAISSLWFGCKKEDNTPQARTYQGKILEENTKTPVEGARVIFYETLYSKTFGGGGITINLDTAFTDKNGNFSFDYTPSKGSSTELSVTASKKNYETTNAFTLSSADNNVFITPYAWVKIRIVNVPPVEQSDFISAGGWLRDEKGFDDFVKSEKCDTVIIKKIWGNKKMQISYRYTTNNKPEVNKRDSVYCKGLDTTFYQILY